MTSVEITTNVHGNIPQVAEARCFASIPSGSVVLSLNPQVVVVFPDGSKHTYSSSAGNCTATEGYSLTINGWIETVLQGGNPPWQSIQDQWPVPPPPSNQNGNPGGNLIALFDGTQDSSRIFQPVLVWGCQAASWWAWWCNIQGGAFWWISAEICDTNCAWTSAIQVNQGDTIFGKVTLTGPYNCGGPVVNPQSYTVHVKDQNTGQSASITGCTGGGNEGFVGALEAYNINSCNQLPNTASETFSSVVSNPYVGSWASPVYRGTPSCSYNANSPDPSTGVLYWTGS